MEVAIKTATIIYSKYERKMKLMTNEEKTNFVYTITAKILGDIDLNKINNCIDLEYEINCWLFTNNGIVYKNLVSLGYNSKFSI